MRFCFTNNNPIKKKNIHPDILATLCLIIFHPFLEQNSSITFPQRVSAKFAKEVEKLGFVVDADSNLDPCLRKYQGKGASVISFGGGLDSLALHCLFPNTTLIHEKAVKAVKVVGSQVVGHINRDEEENKEKEVGIDKLLKKLLVKSYVIETNGKTLTSPDGYTGWICCISTSLLMATELGVTNIVLGSSMASCLNMLKNKTRDFSFPNTSMWSLFLFNALNINLVLPILGLSEIALVKLIPTDLLDLAVWCDKDRGFPCKKCAKCFRRYLLVADSKGSVANSDWSGYNNLAVHTLLRASQKGASNNHGPSLNYLLRKNALKLPNWIEHYNVSNYSHKVESVNTFSESMFENLFEIRDFENSKSMLNSWYSRSLKFIPESLHTYVQERITDKIRPMTEDEMDSI
jgi:hypothetical protein